MSVAGKAQVEGERSEIVRPVAEALDRSAEAKAHEVAVDRRAGVGAKDANQVERRAMNLPGEFGQSHALGEVSVEKQPGLLGPGAMRGSGVMALSLRSHSSRRETFRYHRLEQTHRPFLDDQRIVARIERRFHRPPSSVSDLAEWSVSL